LSKASGVASPGGQFNRSASPFPIRSSRVGIAGAAPTNLLRSHVHQSGREEFRLHRSLRLLAPAISRRPRVEPSDVAASRVCMAGGLILARTNYRAASRARSAILKCLSLSPIGAQNSEEFDIVTSRDNTTYQWQPASGGSFVPSRISRRIPSCFGHYKQPDHSEPSVSMNGTVVRLATGTGYTSAAVHAWSDAAGDYLRETPTRPPPRRVLMADSSDEFAAAFLEGINAAKSGGARHLCRDERPTTAHRLK